MRFWFDRIMLKLDYVMLCHGSARGAGNLCQHGLAPPYLAVATIESRQRRLRLASIAGNVRHCSTIQSVTVPFPLPRLECRTAFHSWWRNHRRLKSFGGVQDITVYSVIQLYTAQLDYKWPIFFGICIVFRCLCLWVTQSPRSDNKSGCRS